MTSSVRSPGARTFTSHDPATGDSWRTYAAFDADEVADAVARARAAAPAWARRDLRERARMLHRFHAALFARRREVAETISRENGRPVGDALASEVLVTLDLARFFAREAPRALRERAVRGRSPAFWRKRGRIALEPYGVVGVIAPWNYPFLLAAGLVLPALAAGNAVVLKPSELTPGSGLLLAELLAEAGVPRELVAVCTGDGATGAAVCAADVDKVFFVGSVETGRRVAESCARRLVPCVLELGGSDPAIVCADANVRHAARGIAWGRFSNAGQTCTAPKRAYVHESAYEPFVAALAEVVRALRVGPGHASDSEVGPLVGASQAAVLRAQLDDALAGGARVLAEAPLPADVPPAARAGWFPPTVLADVRPDARVLREETFGPLLPVVRVRDDDEAVRLANASRYGLSASVWTRDPRRASAIASRLQAGTVAVNDSVFVAGMPELPHGGVKDSGIGRSHGVAGLLECVRPKAVVHDRLPSIAQPWWFGGSAGARDAAIDAFARLVHGRGVRARLRALPGALRLLRRH